MAPAVFKTVIGRARRARGGFDSHTFPPSLAAASVGRFPTPPTYLSYPTLWHHPDTVDTSPFLGSGHR